MFEGACLLVRGKEPSLGLLYCVMRQQSRTVDILGEQFFVLRSGPVCCRTFSSVPASTQETKVDVTLPRVLTTRNASVP